MPKKVCLVKAMVFPVVVEGCESWTIMKPEIQKIDPFILWCWRRLESPLDNKIKPVNSKGNQYWMFIGRTGAEAETPILWPPHVKTRLIEKDATSGKDWRQEEKGATEYEMVGWHHLTDMSLSKLWEIVKDRGGWCSVSPWGQKESNTTYWLNNNNSKCLFHILINNLR